MAARDRDADAGLGWRSAPTLLEALQQAGSVGTGVDVLAGDQAVAEGKDVDAVPFDGAAFRVRRGRGPFADHEVIAEVAAPATKRRSG
jgi:hypothetical protein